MKPLKLSHARWAKTESTPASERAESVARIASATMGFDTPTASDVDVTALARAWGSSVPKSAEYVSVQLPDGVARFGWVSKRHASTDAFAGMVDVRLDELTTIRVAESSVVPVDANLTSSASDAFVNLPEVTHAMRMAQSYRRDLELSDGDREGQVHLRYAASRGEPSEDEVKHIIANRYGEDVYIADVVRVQPGWLDVEIRKSASRDGDSATKAFASKSAQVTMGAVADALMSGVHAGEPKAHALMEEAMKSMEASPQAHQQMLISSLSLASKSNPRLWQQISSYAARLAPNKLDLSKQPYTPAVPHMPAPGGNSDKTVNLSDSTMSDKTVNQSDKTINDRTMSDATSPGATMSDKTNPDVMNGQTSVNSPAYAPKPARRPPLNRPLRPKDITHLTPPARAQTVRAASLELNVAAAKTANWLIPGEPFAKVPKTPKDEDGIPSESSDEALEAFSISKPVRVGDAVQFDVAWDKSDFGSASDKRVQGYVKLFIEREMHAMRPRVFSWGAPHIADWSDGFARVLVVTGDPAAVPYAVAEKAPVMPAREGSVRMSISTNTNDTPASKVAKGMSQREMIPKKEEVDAMKAVDKKQKEEEDKARLRRQQRNQEARANESAKGERMTAQVHGSEHADLGLIDGIVVVSAGANSRISDREVLEPGASPEDFAANILDGIRMEGGIPFGESVSVYLVHQVPQAVFQHAQSLAQLEAGYDCDLIDSQSNDPSYDDSEE